VSGPARTIAPLDPIKAHAWRRATLTTYSFSALFVEAVLVEALMRQGVAEITSSRIRSAIRSAALRVNKRLLSGIAEGG